MRWTRDESELMHARAKIALANRARLELEAPIDTVWVHIKETEAVFGRQKWCVIWAIGKLCIHPDQVDP